MVLNGRKSIAKKLVINQQKVIRNVKITFINIENIFLVVIWVFLLVEMNIYLTEEISMPQQEIWRWTFLDGTHSWYSDTH